MVLGIFLHQRRKADDGLKRIFEVVRGDGEQFGFESAGFFGAALLGFGSFEGARQFSIQCV